MKARRRHAPETCEPDTGWKAGGDPAPLGSAVSSRVEQRGWNERLEGARIHQHWTEIAGEQLAAHAEPVRLRAGVLVLRAESAVWATQVHYLSGELAARANAVLGPDQVRKVSVTTGPLHGAAS